MGTLANPVTPNPQFYDSDVPLLPTRLRQGDSWNWNVSFPNYPSSQYTLQFILNSPNNRFAFPSGVIEEDADSVSFDVALSPTQTAACVPDTYDFIAVLTQAADANDGEIAQQITFVLQSVAVDVNILTASGGVDTRSVAKKNLDAIEATLIGNATSDIQEYMIAGRQVRRFSREELLKERAYWRYIYDAERRARGEYVPPKGIGFRFTVNA